MNWELLKSDFYFRDGALRNIVVFDFSQKCWQKWIKFANENYKLEWWHIYNGKDNEIIVKINFEQIKYMWDNPDSERRGPVSMYFDELRLNVHFFEEDFFECDFWPEDIKSENDHNNIIRFMTDISYLLDKEVFLYVEGFYKIGLNAYEIKIYKDTIEHQEVAKYYIKDHV
jgi:hypothetical protein